MKARPALLLAGAILIVAVGALAGYLLAAQGDQETAAVAATTGAGEEGGGLPEGWTLCRNEAAGYAVAYPEDWHVAEGADGFACSFFDPEEVELREGTELPYTALEAHPLDEGVPYDDILAGLTDETFERVLAQEEKTVAGFPAVLLETEATGAGLLEEGARTYGYVVDRDGSAFVVRTTAFDPADLAGRREIVDTAARTLSFFEPADAAGATMEAVPDELPPAVRGTYEALLGAAEAGDYDALARIGDHPVFTYTFGGAEDGPAAFWRRVERRSGESPAEILAALLALPHEREDGIYVWRFGEEAGASLGWRTGIREDGTWLFFVAGD